MSGGHGVGSSSLLTPTLINEGVRSDLTPSVFYTGETGVKQLKNYGNIQSPSMLSPLKSHDFFIIKYCIEN